MRLRAQQDPDCPLDHAETGDAHDTTTNLRVHEVIGDFSGALTVSEHTPHRALLRPMTGHLSWNSRSQA